MGWQTITNLRHEHLQDDFQIATIVKDDITITCKLNDTIQYLYFVIIGFPSPQKRTIVKYGLLQLTAMVLWNFDLLWKNYGTIEKTMVLTENYGSSIYEGKNHGR